MDDVKAQEILDKIISQIFSVKNEFSLEQFKKKFAFDVRLPNAVVDSEDETTTWSSTTNPQRFTKFTSLIEKNKSTEGMHATEPLNSLDDVLAAWDKVNVRVTERQIDSTNIAKSDGVVECINIYYSQDIGRSRNILFSDGMSDCEFLAASQRCRESNFCIRLDDSVQCSNSFGISCCSKVERSFMMHSCLDMKDSMFCTGMTGHQFCIANMQFSEEEYKRIRQQVIQWILSPVS